MASDSPEGEEGEQQASLRVGQNRLLEMIATNTPLAEILGLLARLVEWHSDGMLCSILLVDDDGRHLRHAAVPSLSSSYVEALDAAGLAGETSGTALFRRGSLTLIDVQTDPRCADLRALMAAEGLRACWSVPIGGAEGQMLGAFVLYYRQSRAPLPAEQRLIEMASYIARIAIERKRSDAALRRSEYRARLILDTAYDAFVGMDVEGRITAWNAQAARLFGWAPEEAVGRTLAETIIPERYREAHRRGLQHFLATGEGPVLNQRIEISALRRDGREVPVELTIWPLQIDGGLAFNAFLHDITERRRTQEQINLLQTITREVAEAPDLNVALDVVLARACETSGWAFGQAWVPRPDGSVLDCSPAWYSSSPRLHEFRLASEAQTFEPGVGLPGRVWAGREPAWIEDVTTSTNFPRAPMAKAAGLKAGLGTPILSGDKVVAVLEFFTTEPRAEDAQLMKVISAVAAQLGLAIERKRAEQALRQAQRNVESLLGSIDGIVWEADAHTFRFHYVSQQAERLLGYPLKRWIQEPTFWRDHIHPDDRDWAVEYCARATRERRPHEFEYRMLAQDGHVVWLQDLVTVIVEDGRATKLRGIMVDITERKRVEQALREAEERYRGIFENATEGIFRSTPEGRYVEVNPALAQMLGYDSANELIGSVGNIGQQLYVDPSRRAEFVRLLKEQPSVRGFIGEGRRKDGSTIWVSLSGRAVRDAKGEIAYFEGIAEDITLRRLQERKIMRLSRIREVLSSINATIVRVSKRQELFEDACRIAVKLGGFGMAWIGVLDDADHTLGVVAAEGIERKSWEALRQPMRQDGTVAATTLERALLEHKPVFGADVGADGWPESIAQRAQELGCDAVACLPLVVGATVVAMLVLHARESSFFDEDESRLLTELAADLSFALDHLEKAERLNYLAYYDVLTGLANRSLFEDRLAQYLQAAALDQTGRAVVVFDLQRFRQVNDTFGRHAGDALLKAVGVRVLHLVEGVGMLARIGADVFALAWADQRDAPGVAHFIENALHECFARPFNVDGTEIHVAPRAGVALFPADGADAESLYRNAEAALKRAKLSSDRYLFYAPEMNARVASALTLENRLRHALGHDEFVLHYQPQVSATNGRVVGLEALVRWQTPDLGLLPPARFIRVAEDMGLIVELGRWILGEACRQARAWLDAGHSDFVVAVNVSALQLHRTSFVDEVRAAILAHRLPPRVLELELTESAIMERVDTMSQSMRALKQLGVTLALDDFGVGYSSLNYLKRLPIDKLKIDQSFVQEITVNQGDAAIVRAIIAMGHQLQMTVLAEGVETAAQLGYLRRNYCDECQGLFFGSAQPAPEAEATLRRRYLNLDAFAATHPSQTLLLLDDEENVLRALVRVLRRDGYRIFTAANANEAFAILGREDVQVIVSDQRMPEISGTEFLNRVKEMYPNTVRMVLSGFTDLQSVTDAINRGAIYKFMTKPWDDTELRDQIRDAFRTYTERFSPVHAA